jgi:hypothetical protein
LIRQEYRLRARRCVQHQIGFQAVKPHLAGQRNRLATAGQRQLVQFKQNALDILLRRRNHPLPGSLAVSRK